MVEEGEPGEKSSAITVPLEQIAKVAASLASVGLNIPVVRKILGEPDLF